MKINVDFANVRSDADVKRQARWREQSVQPIKAARAHRLKLLLQERDAIRRAADAYTLLDDGDVPMIRLRDDFVAIDFWRPTDAVDEREPVDPSTDEGTRQRRRRFLMRPPLTRLVHRQTKALSLYLTATYVAHLTTKAGNAFENKRRNLYGKTDGQSGWIWLAGLSTPRDEAARRARMRRALDELVAAGLATIDTPGARGRYENWILRADDGTGTPYRVPSEREPQTVKLPAAFFFNGWHLVLAPGEIAMLLVIMHRSRWIGDELGEQHWVSLPMKARRRIYGISDEMYLHAQQLVELGLIEFRDPMPNRRRGKIQFKRERTKIADGIRTPGGGEDFVPVPYEFRPCSAKIFNEDAFTVVSKTFSALPIPHRLDSEGALIRPQEYVEAMLKAKAARMR